jgi:transglutaminase-like putative cysteine protease
MQIRVGYEITYENVQPTPIVFMLGVHFTRQCDLIVPDHLNTEPAVPVAHYYDSYGNRCSRVVAPRGQLRVSTDAVVEDAGVPDAVPATANMLEVQDLPAETLVFLLGSRYCETDLLMPIAWDLFGGCRKGWPLVQAICDFVHGHMSFGYEYARTTRTAWEAYQERKGVCRDFTHLAVTLCRCMNIPARYCTGYLSDIGQPPPYPPMDFAAWFEFYLGDRWYTWDARFNQPRVGRILLARGRDATDVPISTAFGGSWIKEFKVWTDEIREQRQYSHA